MVRKPLKPALTILFMIVLFSGCIRTGKESTSVKPQEEWEWIFGPDQWKEFLYYRAELLDDSSDERARHMADMAVSYMEKDPYYTSGQLEPPELKYFKVSYYGRKAESYYLVWLPDNWNQQQIKKSSIILPGARCPGTCGIPQAARIRSRESYGNFHASIVD